MRLNGADELWCRAVDCNLKDIALESEALQRDMAGLSRQKPSLGGFMSASPHGLTTGLVIDGLLPVHRRNCWQPERWQQRSLQLQIQLVRHWRTRRRSFRCLPLTVILSCTMKQRQGSGCALSCLISV